MLSKFFSSHVGFELARFAWETRKAFRRPGGASRGRALKTREDRKKREFFGGARRKAREPQEPQEALWQTESTGEAWRVAARGGRDPHRNASSRVLRRLASRSPRGPGVALRRGPLKRGDAFLVEKSWIC